MSVQVSSVVNKHPPRVLLTIREAVRGGGRDYTGKVSVPSAQFKKIRYSLFTMLHLLSFPIHSESISDSSLGRGGARLIISPWVFYYYVDIIKMASPHLFWACGSVFQAMSRS